MFSLGKGISNSHKGNTLQIWIIQHRPLELVFQSGRMTPTYTQSLDSCQQLFLLPISQKNESKIYFSHLFAKFGEYLSNCSGPSTAQGSGASSPVCKSESPRPQGANLGVPQGGRLETNKYVNKEISFFFFFKQALASFIKEKLYMIYFSPVCSGMLLIISESPGSMIASVHTLQCFPHAVPNSILLPLQ